MADINMQRRAFFKGKSPAKNNEQLWPPWIISPSIAYENCERCQECITACPTKIIIHGDGQFPEIDFSQGECTLCGACADACHENIFIPKSERNTRNAWSLNVDIKANCLSMNRVMCRSCGDNCEASAIHFRLEVGGVSEPIVDSKRCTGCGACAYSCPTQSINIMRIQSAN